MCENYDINLAALPGFANMITLSIIVLTFNTPDLTLKCIQSLVGQYRREFEQSTFEIIVVDNGSKEEFNPSTSLRARVQSSS